MASSLSLHRTTAIATRLTKSLRLFSSSSLPSHEEARIESHEYLDPNPFVSSWVPPKDPIEAHRMLHRLRLDYKKQVNSLRKVFAAEVEVARIEELRCEEARKEAEKLEAKEKKKLLSKDRKAKRHEYKVFRDELRVTLEKEREARLEYWKKREQRVQKKKKQKSELIRRKSSEWIEPHELNDKVRNIINEKSI